MKILSKCHINSLPHPLNYFFFIYPLTEVNRVCYYPWFCTKELYGYIWQIAMEKSLMERNKIKHFLVYGNKCLLNHTPPGAMLLGICKPSALLHIQGKA